MGRKCVMIKKTLERLNKYSSFVTGFTAGMKLEHRIFNIMCLIAMFLLAISIPLDIYIGQDVTALLFGLLFLALVLVYYIARFKQRYNLAIILVSTFAPFVIAVNYFVSGGIWGVTLPSLVLSFFLIVIIAPRKVAWLLMLLCLLGCILLPLIEYHFPHTVKSSYDQISGRFIDTTYTTIISILAIYAGIESLKNAYYSEKKRADQRAAELEKLNNEKNKLFSIVSHDLRAPLASIQNYLSLLKLQHLDLNERQSLEQRLSNTVNGTQEMLDNLLHWSRAQLEKIHFSLKENRVDEMLLPLMKLQKTVAEEKGIKFSWHFNCSYPVLSETNMFQLIVRNLTSNAIKFTPKGGLISVTVNTVDENCLVAVKDNGRGISPEEGKDIFSLSGKSTYGTDNEKGIGLGLYLCKEYTAIQNGKIWHESDTNTGTTFYVLFPHVNSTSK